MSPFSVEERTGREGRAARRFAAISRFGVSHGVGHLGLGRGWTAAAAADEPDMMDQTLEEEGQVTEMLATSA